MLSRFRPYLSYLRPVRGTLTAAILAGIIYGGRQRNGAGLAVDGPLGIPEGSSIPRGCRSGAGLSLGSYAMWLPIVFTVRGIAGYLNSYLIQVAGVKILEALRLDYFRKLQVLPLSFLQRQTTGDLISRGMADTNQLQTTLTTVANDGMKQPASLVFALGFLITLTAQEKGSALMIAALAILPICVFPVRYVGKKLVKRAYQMQTQMGSVTNSLSENLGAAKEVRAFGLEDRQAGAFAQETSALIRVQLKVAKYAQALTPAIEIISACGIALVFVVAQRQGVGLEAFLAIVTALYVSYDPIKKLGAINNEIKRGEAALNRLEHVFNEPVSIRAPRAAAGARLRARRPLLQEGPVRVWARRTSPCSWTSRPRSRAGRSARS